VNLGAFERDVLIGLDGHLARAIDGDVLAFDRHGAVLLGDDGCTSVLKLKVIGACDRCLLSDVDGQILRKVEFDVSRAGDLNILTNR